jgi:hypothetical protein
VAVRRLANTVTFCDGHGVFFVAAIGQFRRPPTCWSTNTEHNSGIDVADGHWHQVALTYQSVVENGTTLYVDGVPVATTTITAANQSNDALTGSAASRMRVRSS